MSNDPTSTPAAAPTESPASAALLDPSPEETPPLAPEAAGIKPTAVVAPAFREPTEKGKGLNDILTMLRDIVLPADQQERELMQRAIIDNLGMAEPETSGAYDHVLRNLGELDDDDFRILENAVGQQSILRSPEHRGEQLYRTHAVHTVVAEDQAMQEAANDLRMISAAVRMFLDNQNVTVTKHDPPSQPKNHLVRMRLRVKGLAWGDRFVLTYDRRSKEFSMVLRQKKSRQSWTSESPEGMIEMFAEDSVKWVGSRG